MVTEAPLSRDLSNSTLFVMLSDAYFVMAHVTSTNVPGGLFDILFGVLYKE